MRGCWQCKDYPCKRTFDKKDFKGIHSNRVWMHTCDEIAVQGFDKWNRTYAEKAKRMEEALARYNNGRLKTFISNLFLNNDLPVLERAMDEGKKIPYVSPAETGPLFKEAVEKMRDVVLEAPQEEPADTK